MRSRELNSFVVMPFFNNAPGSAKYVTWTNPSNSSYAVTVDSGYEVLGVAPVSLAGGSQSQLSTNFNSGSQSFQVTFLNAAGSVATLGGQVAITLRKRTA
jgi:hypothetical protein